MKATYSDLTLCYKCIQWWCRVLYDSFFVRCHRYFSRLKFTNISIGKVIHQCFIKPFHFISFTKCCIILTFFLISCSYNAISSIIQLNLHRIIMITYHNKVNHTIYIFLRFIFLIDRYICLSNKCFQLIKVSFVDSKFILLC